MFDVDLEIARTVREAEARVVARIQGEQHGEAWAGLDDRRQAPNPMRGADRRGV